MDQIGELNQPDVDFDQGSDFDFVFDLSDSCKGYKYELLTYKSCCVGIEESGRVDFHIENYADTTRHRGELPSHKSGSTAPGLAH